MTCSDVNPYINRQFRETIKMRNGQKINEKLSKFYKCKKCKSDTDVETRQMRRGDEGRTIILTCKCGFKQNISGG